MAAVGFTLPPTPARDIFRRASGSTLDGSGFYSKRPQSIHHRPLMGELVLGSRR